MVSATSEAEMEELMAPFQENKEEFLDFCVGIGIQEAQADYDRVQKQVEETALDELPNYLQRYKRDGLPESLGEFVKCWHGYDVLAEDGSAWGYTGNPNAKWDWYQVGGRWKGYLFPDYNPEEDPVHKRTCYMCKGTGKRPDMEVTDGCNVCAGTGIETVWPTSWPTRYDLDAPLVSEVDWQAMRRDKALTFAFINKAGEWIDRDSHGEGKYSRNAEPDGYDRAFWEFVGGLRPDDRVWIVDCRI